MYGAIIGDLAGSIYEFEQTKQIHSVIVDKIIEENSFYSDDTILTMAILDAILNKEEVIHYEKYIKRYIQEYKNYKPNFQLYFKTAFSPDLIKWSEGKIEGRSKGNGAMMRISPIGYLFNNEWDIIRQSTLATYPSHYSYEAMDASQTIALIIYYARSGMKKEDIIYRLAIARALLMKTEIILFDEATSALDNETQSEIQNAIENLKGEYTILIVAHRLSTIIDSDCIFVVEDGKVIDKGTHKELLKKCAFYKNLYEKDLQV